MKYILLLLVIPQVLICMDHEAHDLALIRTLYYNRQLSRAANTNNSAGIQQALDNGADINSYNNGLAPLHWAAYKGHSAVIKYLLDAQADIQKKDEAGHTVLHWAVRCGKVEIVQLLLDNGAQLDKLDNSQHSVLYTAAGAGHADIVKLLLTKKIAQTDKENLLEAAAVTSTGHPAVIDLLLANNIEVNTPNKDGQTALHCAAKCGHSHVIQLLLEHGASPHITDSLGSTALHSVLLSQPLQESMREKARPHLPLYAIRLVDCPVRGDSTESLRLLLEYGSAIEDTIEFYLPVAWRHSKAIVKEKLGITSETDVTLLILLNNTRSIKALENLTAKNSITAQRLNTQDTLKFTPLMWAAARNNTRALKLLLDYITAKKVCADLSITNAQGNSALSLAHKHQHNTSITLLHDYLKPTVNTISDKLTLPKELQDIVIEYIFGGTKVKSRSTLDR